MLQDAETITCSRVAVVPADVVKLVVVGRAVGGRDIKASRCRQVVTVAGVDNGRCSEEAGLQVWVDDVQVLRRYVTDVVRRLQRTVDAKEPLRRRRCQLAS